MLSKLHTQYIAFFSILAIALNWIFFGNLSVDFIFLIGNVSVVFITLLLFNFCQNNFTELSEKAFRKNIFWFSLGLRVFAVLFYYYLFYYITGTEFDVEAIDALSYDEIAKATLEEYNNDSLSFASFFISVGGNFDDGGYVIFLSLIYYLFDNSILAVRLIQALVGAMTVVLVYKTSKEVFDERTGKLAAIITATFQPLLLYTSVHLKEILMLHFLFVFIYHSTQLFNNKKNQIISIAFILFGLIGMFSVRAILGLCALVSLVGYLMLSGDKIFTKKKITILFSIAAIIYVLASSISILNETVNKSKAYLGIKSDDKKTGTVGGISQDAYLNDGQSFAKYAGGGVFLVQSIIMPYPSMVKTNVVFFNQTLQWYFAGGLLIWVLLSYYAYVGIYAAVKEKFKQTSLLLFIVGIYTVSLISSMYITSIRYNIVKLAVLIPFVAYGIVLSSDRVKKNFIKYAIFVTMLVLLWNYIKIAGRGLA